VQIRSFAHKGLRLLYTEDRAKDLPAESVDKLRKMLAFLSDMDGPNELYSLATWKAHSLTGPRKGTWSLHVTRNWRLTFRVDAAAGLVYDVDLEDYH
jgi:proteic killer suppression protein